LKPISSRASAIAAQRAVAPGTSPLDVADAPSPRSGDDATVEALRTVLHGRPYRRRHPAGGRRVGGRRSDGRAKDPVVVQVEIIGRQFDVVCDDENVINIDRSLLSAR
jgi:hypothetical protein